MYLLTTHNSFQLTTNNDNIMMYMYIYNMYRNDDSHVSDSITISFIW